MFGRDASPTGNKGRVLSAKRSYFLGFLMLGLWAAVALRRVWGDWGEDLAALYMAGHMIRIGKPELVYLVSAENFVNSVPEAWLPEMARLGVGGLTAFPYIYPPLWAVLVAPLTGWLGPRGFNDLFAVAQVSLMVLGVWLAWRLAGRAARIPFWAWAGFSGLLLQTGFVPAFALELMQPQIAVTILCILSVERLAHGRNVAAGVALAVAAAIKLTPAVLVVIFLLERRWHALAAFLLSAAALLAVGLAVAGGDLHAAFLENTSRIRGVMVLTCPNFSISSTLYALWYQLGLVAPLSGEIKNTVIHGPPVSITLLSKVLLAAVLLVAWHAGRRLSEAWRLPYMLFQLTLFAGLFGPFSWGHYFLVQVLLAPVLLALAGRAVRFGAGFAVVLGGSVLTVVRMNMWPDPGFTCASAAALTLFAVGLAVSVVAGRAARGHWPAPGPLRPNEASL
ncbi:glycosyltransferase family 87 protein [Rhodovulum euryhalinum]|uniref:glycosyltransferase family 87 protein n=1 Tax=Rhodovulum euryhalinum TaxID=35805 RepID=UPI001404F1B4|nr:glycosyltransferase family 87 protein [Rhodovulum euryhalinum]